MIPILEPIDHFILEYDYSPLVVFTVGYLLCHYYPSLRQWSTARGDTVIIIGSVIGFSIGSYLNNKLGFLHKPDEPPLYDIHFPNVFGYMLAILRTFLGLLLVLGTRQLFKKFLLKFLCFICKLDHLNPENKKKKKIELPYNYLTYFAIGVNIAFTFPFLFRLLRIERDYSFTEL